MLLRGPVRGSGVDQEVKNPVSEYKHYCVCKDGGCREEHDLILQRIAGG